MKEFCQQLLQLRVYRRRVGKKRTIRRPHEGQTAMTRERGPLNKWDESPSRGDFTHYESMSVGGHTLSTPWTTSADTRLRPIAPALLAPHGFLSAKGLLFRRLSRLKPSHVGFRNEEFCEAAIQANQKSGEYPNGRLLEVLRTGKVDVEFRRKLNWMT
jgi:hypothetical protein